MADNLDFRVKNGLVVATTASIAGTVHSTSTVANNALYVAGGVGIGNSLLVTGEAVFQSNVVFNGTTTYVLTTNTVYTDNVIELHYPNNIGNAWLVNDNKDIGLRFHYYDTSDKNAFLGRNNTDGFLEWLVDASADNIDNITGTAGSFRAGSIALTNSTASSNTASGALTVTGGVGIGGNLYVGGTIYGVADVTGIITTASNITAGTAGQLLYQSAAGVTSFVGPGTSGDVLVSNGTSTPTYNNTLVLSGTTSATNTSSGALQVRGGVGIGGALYVASTSYINSSKILTAIDLETVTTHPVYITNNPALVAVAGTSTTYGTYNTGTIASVMTASDYLSPGGYYSINDAATQPAHIVYVGFTGVTGFTRLVVYINYTVGSTHTIDIDLYNYVTSSWDTFSVYSGTTNYFQFILQVDDDTKYTSAGVVTARIYHASFGNIVHETRIDYVALEDSIQGGQGPRGAVGATGATGPQGLTTTTTSTFIFSNTASSTSTNTGAVVVYGGVGIGENINIGGGAKIAGITTITNITAASNTTTGALQVVGGTGIGGNLYVGGNIVGLSTLSNTSTLASNSLYIAGGVGIAKTLLVSGEAIFQSNVIFSGTSTYIYSTNTVYTDNLINIHVPSGSTGSNHSWVVDDGKDIGFIYHYYKGQDKDAFLGLANDSGYLEWYANGDESGGIFTGTSYGTFKTGSIVLVDTTASTTTATGALTVAGGVGIGGNLNVGGTIYGYASVTGIITTASNIYGGTSGQIAYQSTAGVTMFVGAGTAGQLLVSAGSTSTGPIFTNTASITVGNATNATNANTATNLASGGPGMVPYQSSTGTTSFIATGTAGTLLISNGNGTAPSFNNTLTLAGTTAATSTTTGALQVVGGVGVGGNLFVGGSTSTFAGSVGIGTTTPTDTLEVGSSYNGLVRLSVRNTSTSTASQIGSELSVYSDVGRVTFGMYGSGHTGTLFGLPQANSAVFFTSSSNPADRFVMGTRTAIPYYIATNDTVRITVSSTGTVSVSSTASATSTATGALQVVGGVGIGGNLYVGGTIFGSINGTITTATSLTAGTTGQIPFQTSAGATSFFGAGTSGQLLVSAGSTSTGPVFTNTASIFVGRSSTATNLDAGAQGSLPYQTGTGTTAMLALTTAGYFLITGATAPQWENPSNVTIGNATKVAITDDASSTTTQYVTFVNTNTGNTGVKVMSTGLTFTPSTGNVGIGTATAASKLDVSGTLRVSGITTVTNITASTSTATGALQVIGGVGVGGSIFVGSRLNVASDGIIGGNLTVTGSNILAGNATVNLINTTATTVNFAGSGTTISIGASTGVTTVNNNLTIAGNFTVQGTTTIVDSTVTNITDPIITIGGLANNQPLTSDDNKDKGIAFKWYGGSAKTGFFGYDDSAGTFVFIPDATITNEVVTGTPGAISASLAGGTSQSLVYQSSSNTTDFLAAATTGSLLQSNGTTAAPSWVLPTGITAGYATTATNLASGGPGMVPYQSSTGTTSFIATGTAGTLLISNGNSAAPSFNNTLTLAGTTAATSTLTGVLQVRGGVGIGGDIYQSGSLVSNGTVEIRGGSLYANSSTTFNLVNTTATTVNFAGSATAITIGATTGYTTIRNQTTITNTASSLSTTTGALQVVGGVGIGGDIYQSGSLVSNGTVEIRGGSLYANSSTTFNLVNTTATTVNFAGSATAITIGATTGYTTIRNQTTITNTTASLSTTTGALQVRGGVGVADSMYVGNRVGFVNTSNVSVVYQFYNTATGSLDTVFG